MARMKLKSRRAVLLAAPLGLAACGLGGQSAENKPIQNVGPAALEIAWENTTNDMGLWVVGEAKKIFEDRNPGVTLNFSGMGNERAKVLAQTAAGTPSNVLHLGVNLPTFYAAKGMLLALDGYISKDRESQKGEFAPNIWDTFSVNGKQYALPREGGPTVLYYNKTLLAAGGVTAPTDAWTMAEQYREAAVKLTKPGAAGGPEVIGTDLGNWRNWLWSGGGDFFDAQRTRYTLDQPAAVESLQLYQDFRYKFRAATTPPENQQQMPMPRFIAGGMAFFPGLRSAGNTRGFVAPHVGIAQHPRGKAGRKFNMPGNGLALMAQPSGSPGAKAVDAAWKMIAWYVSPEFQKMHYKAGIGGVVARLSVLKSEEYLNSAIPREWNEFFAKGVADLYVPPKLTNWPEIDEAVNMELAQFQNGQETAAQVTSRIAPIVNAMLKEGQR